MLISGESKENNTGSYFCGNIVYISQASCNMLILQSCTQCTPIKPMLIFKALEHSGCTASIQIHKGTPVLAHFQFIFLLLNLYHLTIQSDSDLLEYFDSRCRLEQFNVPHQAMLIDFMIWNEVVHQD